MTSNHNKQPEKVEEARKIPGSAGDLSNPYNRQEKIKVDPAKPEVRQTTEDLKERLRELLVIRFLS
jgi:hypothetical protein